MKADKNSKVNEEDILNQLIDEWIRLSMCYSNINASLKLEPAQKILAMGPKVIPWIYRRMLDGGDQTFFLFIFLKELGVEVIIPKERQGFIAYVQREYIRAGIELGYITEDQVKSLLNL